jgi:hypothetical protein
MCKVVRICGLFTIKQVPVAACRPTHRRGDSVVTSPTHELLSLTHTMMPPIVRPTSAHANFARLIAVMISATEPSGVAYE